jgi:hypothetical protein
VRAALPDPVGAPAAVMIEARAGAAGLPPEAGFLNRLSYATRPASKPMRKRDKRTIQSEYSRLSGKVWWNRHVGRPEPDNKFWQDGEDVARGIEDRYGKEFLDPGDDIEWGICLGKFMALAWVLGAEWDEAGDT